MEHGCVCCDEQRLLQPEKIDGYKNAFEENETIKEFCHNGLKIRVRLLVRADDIARIPMQYRDYWSDRIDTMLETTCR